MKEAWQELYNYSGAAVLYPVLHFERKLHQVLFKLFARLSLEKAAFPF